MSDLRIGRLTKEPTTKMVNGSNGEFAVLENNSIACRSEFRKDKDGKNITDFIAIKGITGGTATFVEKYFSKGEAILLEGEVFEEVYTTKENEERRQLAMMVDRVRFVEGASYKKCSNNNNGGNSNAQPQQSQPQQSSNNGSFMNVGEDSLPSGWGN